MKRKLKLFAAYEYAFEGSNSLECEVIKETKNKFYVRALIWQFRLVTESTGYPEYQKPKVPYGEIKIFNKDKLLGWEIIK